MGQETQGYLKFVELLVIKHFAVPNITQWKQLSFSYLNVAFLLCNYKLAVSFSFFIHRSLECDYKQGQTRQGTFCSLSTKWGHELVPYISIQVCDICTQRRLSIIYIRQQTVNCTDIHNY